MQASDCLIQRRSLLKWSTPMIAAVALPAHAQTTAPPGPPPPDPDPDPEPGSFDCGSTPVLEAQEAAKCVGDNPVLGDVILTLYSDGADPDNVEINIVSVSHNAGAEHTLTIELASLPATVSDTGGVQIGWVGEASDLQTCLPTPDVTITVTYSCGASAEATVDFSLADVVAQAIP